MSTMLWESPWPPLHGHNSFNSAAKLAESLLSQDNDFGKRVYGLAGNNSVSMVRDCATLVGGRKGTPIERELRYHINASRSR